MGRVRAHHDRLPIIPVTHRLRLRLQCHISIIAVGLLLRVDEAAVLAVARQDAGGVDTLLGMFVLPTTTIITLKLPVLVVVRSLLLVPLSIGMTHAEVRPIRVDRCLNRCRMVHPTRRSLVVDMTHLFLAVPLILAARPWELPL